LRCQESRMPPSKSKTNRGDEALRPREREIYEAAARIFYEKGYASTTNQDVAEAVGMLKGSLYYYIETKEDLLYGVMKMAYATLVDHLDQTRGFTGNELERLRFFIVGYAQLVLENLIPVAVLERNLRSVSEPRRLEVVTWRDEYEAFARDLLRAGQEAGLIRHTIDVRMQSIMIFTEIHGLHTWYKPTGDRTPTEIAELIADFVLHGVATQKRSLTAIPGERCSSPAQSSYSPSSPRL
jgi:AcrR family transcriptional regulator